jgi:Arc/MetJ-type ribon-helix-helix transcriptional regulator
MADTEKLEIKLPSEVMEMVRQRVATGDYPSADALILHAIHTLIQDDNLDWLPPDEILKQLVQQALDDPRPPISASDVRKHLNRRLQQAQQEESRARRNGAA